MNRNPANRIAVFAAIMVGIGAVLSSLAGYLFVLNGVPTTPRAWLLPDPIGWGFTPRSSPLALLGMLLALAVVVALVWLFARMIVRAALPSRGSAVFFGIWGAVIIASLAAGIVRAPLVLAYLQINTAPADTYQTQFYITSTAGVAWGLVWGWLPALVAVLIHRAAGRAAEIPDVVSQIPYGPTDAYPPAPAQPPAPMYPPAPHTSSPPPFTG